MEDDSKLIPFEVIRKVVNEPLPPSDQREWRAQADRMRILMEGQPLYVRRLARALTRARWDKLSREVSKRPS